MGQRRLGMRACGSVWCLGWGMALLFGVSGVEAQDAPDAVGQAQSVKPTTLAEALRGVGTSGETALAVDVDKTLPAPGAALPPTGSRVTQIAPAYGYTTRRYGGVTAVAPATMTLLNDHLGLPNIYLNIPAREAFTLLAANMNDAQLQMLTSERGLGLSDMNSDLQRGLFLALLPDSSLPYNLRSAPGQLGGGGGGSALQNPLQNGRLRVGMKQQVLAHTPGKDTMGLTQSMRDPNGPPIYDAANQEHLFGQDVVDGATVRSVIANTLKKSQLNYALPALRTLVSAQGVKTVGELIARIGEKTGLELYADRHYEAKPLLLAGVRQPAPAGDWLRALAVCVTGTYRRVGPAYVLTDDIAGVAARRVLIADFQSDADAQRQKPLVEAEDKLQQSRALWKRPLSGFGDPLAPTPEQMARKELDQLGGGAFRTMELNFDQLTPGQQDALKRYSDAAIQANPDGSYKGIDFERPVQMFAVPSVQLLVPGVDGPIDTDIGQWVSDNFHDMSHWKPRHERKAASNPNAGKTSEEALPPLSGLTAAIPHRALLADCRTVADVDNTVAKMRRMGLNELWLVVFTNGVARIGGTSFPTLAPDAPDLLAHALKTTQGTGIALYPVIDVFQWGAATPATQVDLTITGETSFQRQQREHRRDMLIAAANGFDPPGDPSPRLTASVFAPEVTSRLNGLVSILARRPGVAGIVWRETDPEGYVELDSANIMRPAGTGQLGYTEAARLAFLRLRHADPIDIPQPASGRGLEQRANTRLPLFDDWELEKRLGQEWNRFRAQANRQALIAMYAAAKPQNDNAQAQNNGNQTQTVRQEGDTRKSGETNPIVFARERRATYGTTWYGLWNGLETGLPTHHYDDEEEAANGDFKIAPEEFQQARTQAKRNFVRLPFWGGLDENALVKQWQKAFKDVAQNKKWDGFVLEMMQ